jgi:dolichol-phosphate mannosyltransferase
VTQLADAPVAKGKWPVRVVHEPKRSTRDGDPDPSASTTGYFPHRYEIDNVIRIGSDVPLPELEYFRTPRLHGDYDIEIRIGPVGSGFRSRARVTRHAGAGALSYHEHLGRLGANFHLELGKFIRLTVTPLFARSPHVLYTNVLEALLRFVAVSHGVMLLHSACLRLNGRGILLSARTDTGKTGTVLRLVRDFGAQFLSDDMTLMSPDGRAYTYPKPLTISHHTLRAVNAGVLSPAEWRRLRVQSRVHSKEGRGIGMWLGEQNIPIMGINAVTQMIVPPPKYVIERLVPCETVPEVDVEQLFVIERGPEGMTDISPDGAIEELIDNTDDAYGFPPFRYFAPSLVIGDDDYETLRRKEIDILTSAMRGIRMRRLACEDYTWADKIAALLGEPSVNGNGYHANNGNRPAGV